MADPRSGRVAVPFGALFAEPVVVRGELAKRERLRAGLQIRRNPWPKRPWRQDQGNPAPGQGLAKPQRHLQDGALFELGAKISVPPPKPARPRRTRLERGCSHVRSGLQGTALSRRTRIRCSPHKMSCGSKYNGAKSMHGPGLLRMVRLLKGNLFLKARLCSSLCSLRRPARAHEASKMHQAIWHPDRPIRSQCALPD
jgi:hypothetical protein